MATLAYAIASASFLSLAQAGDFVQRADALFNSPEELTEMYVNHKVSHANQEKSELDVLLADMHQYVLDNEDSHAPKNVLTILTDDQGWVNETETTHSLFI